MQIHYAAAATLLLTGVATAQNPNAVGLWKTDAPTFSLLFIPSVAPGATGNHVWQCLPPDLITYFRPQSAGGARELDFRGVELKLGAPPNLTATPKVHAIPGFEIRRAVQANAPNEGGLVPYVNAANPSDGLFVNVPAPGNYTVAANKTTNSLFTFKSFLTTPVSVSAGSAAGDGLCFRMVDYMKQFGSSATAPMSICLVMTTNENPNSNVTSYSGQTVGVANTIFQGTWEFCVSYFFEQSMIQPVRNAKLLTPGSVTPGGTLPAAVNFPVSMDDGHSAYTPQPGDVLSYSANSNKSLSPATASTNVWIVPFVLFEGDVSPGFDPNPENWVGNGGFPQNAYIYPMPLQKWINDLATVFGAVSDDLGGKLNPNNSTLGMWMGLDLPNLVNFNVILNSFVFSDTSAAAQSGPETKIYDLTTNPTGILVRNFFSWNATIQGELRSLQTPQVGYTPFSPVGANIGLGAHPGIPAVSGLAVHLTCWVLDLSAPPSVNPIGSNIIDMTNVIRFKL